MAAVAAETPSRPRGAMLPQRRPLEIGPMDLLNHLKLALLRHREFRKVSAELESHSERELMADLRLNRSAIPAIAAEAADQRVAALVQSHPEYRRAWEWHDRQAGAGYPG